MPKTFSFPKQTKVAEVAHEAGVAFGYPSDQQFDVVRKVDGSVLQPERTLVSYHIEDDEVLVLSAKVAGV